MDNIYLTFDIETLHNKIYKLVVQRLLFYGRLRPLAKEPPQNVQTTNNLK